MLSNLIFALFSLTPINKDILNLKTDLVYDRRVFNDHGANIYHDVKSYLRLFDFYANMPLNRFSVSKKAINGYCVTKWLNRSGTIIIYEVEAKIATDTMDVAINIGNNKKDVNPLKKGGFNKFRIYVIKSKKHGILTYTTQINYRLVDFSVNGKWFSPVYEDIALGVKYPDEKEISRMLVNQ